MTISEFQTSQSEVEYEYIDTESNYQPLIPATKHNDENLYVQLNRPGSTRSQGFISLRKAAIFCSNADQGSTSTESILPTDPSELTTELLAKADAHQAQLWMLLQMQKMV